MYISSGVEPHRDGYAREEINALRNRVTKLEKQVKGLLEKDKPRITNNPITG